MAITIEAVYENGVFRPLQPVQLTDGQKVVVSIQPVPRDITPAEALEQLDEVQKAFAEIPDDEWAEIKADILGDRGPTFTVR